MVRLKKVLVCGVFDLLHLGHLRFFKQARHFGNHLTVLVARDSNVLKAKGRKPFFRERERLRLLSSLKAVDRVVLGDARSLYKGVLKAKPDVLVLGYDQLESAGKLLGLAGKSKAGGRGKKFSETEIEETLARRGLRVKVVRLRGGLLPARFKSSKIKARLKLK